jgi:uncharacterized membrane protein
MSVEDLEFVYSTLIVLIRLVIVCLIFLMVMIFDFKQHVKDLLQERRNKND